MAGVAAPVNVVGPHCEFETRNPKFETISNAKNQKVPNKPVSDFVIGILIFGFVSVRGAAFELRISDFIFLASWRETL